MGIVIVTAAFCSLRCGGSSSTDTECRKVDDCGQPGQVLCLSGRCEPFEDLSAYGSVVLDLSFDRDMVVLPTSGYVYFLLPELVDGQTLSCADIINGQIKASSPATNPLLAEAAYLVFNGTGTFFPNNLIQLIRPANQALVVAEGFERLYGEGTLLAIGCHEKIVVQNDQTTQGVVVQLDTPAD